MPVNILTRSFGPYRDGANLQETTLTAEGVRANGIRHLFDLDLPGDKRGVEGMPLVVTGLTMADGMPHDVAFVASMSNDVRAFDLNDGTLLWQQRIGRPIPGTKKMDFWQINDNWGVLSTPTINLATKTLYLVNMHSPTGLLKDVVFYLHAVSLFNGAHQAAPLNLNTATYRSPISGKASVLGSVARKQRPGLLFDSRNGVDTVFIAFGSFAESADTNQGWVIACGVTDHKLTIEACWASSVPPLSGNGIWQAGQGPCMDDAGFIYVMTGNGGFDGTENLGESFVKLQYVPRNGGAPASLKPVDHFTPFTDTGRVGGDPTLAAISLLPNQGGNDEPGGSSNMDSPDDQDLNSGGPLYIPKSITGYSKNVLMGAGKDGIVYVVDADNMGQTKLASFAPDRIQKEVYGALLSRPIGFTYYPGDMDPAPSDLSKLSTTYGSYTHHQHSTPCFYVSSDHGPIVLTGGENGPVRAFKFNADFTLTYLGCGAEIASEGVPPPGGMPGTMMSLSANGKEAGILWCTQPMPGLDANKKVGPGRLIAYAANWFVNGAMVKLWSSDQWNIQFAYNKFTPPMCVNGKVLVPTYDGRVMVFG